MNKLALLALLAVPCYALPPESHHQTELLPAMEFTEECNSKGGSNKRKGVELVRRTVSPDGLAAVIYGRITQITCTMPEKPPEELESAKLVELSWNPVTERIDGTKLQPGETLHYEIQINSDPFSVVQGNTWRGTLSSGHYTVSLRHVDSFGLPGIARVITFEVGL